MEQLSDLLSKSPKLSSMNLEFCEIEDISPLLPLLSKFSSLEELILFGNRLESLPRDLSVLKHIKKLDISNNMLESASQILPSLKSLTSLIDLNITLNTPEEEELLLASLPNLLRLNDTEIASTTSIDYQGPESLTQDDLEKIACMYDDIRSCAKDIDPALDKRFAADFDENVKEIMGELSEVIKNESHSYLTNAHMLAAKFSMFRVCQDKVAFLALKSSKKLGTIVKELGDANKGIFEQMGKLIFEAHPKYMQKINNVQAEVSRACSQNTTLVKTVERLEQELDAFKAQQKYSMQGFEEEKQELLRELESLQEENKKYLDTIIKHSKNNAGTALNTSTYEDKPKLLSQALSSRTLSLRQLKEAIGEIYDSKAKFDEKCSESKMPRETMEQHMYTFLNQKYGLRSLIIEWVAAIITGIKTYSAEDNDVSVFGKILRNECDEEFRFVQNQVRETVVELLRLQIKNKYLLKPANEIQKIVDEKIQGSLSEEEWSEIVKYMYNESDSHTLLNLIWTSIQQKNTPQQNKGRTSREDLHKKELKSTVVLYSDFLKTLLDFQLRTHEKFLSPFLKIFRSLGNEKNGIINEEEFILLSKALHLDDESISKLLSIVDPYENQAITFSECVALFSTEVAPSHNIPILQDLSLNST